MSTNQVSNNTDQDHDKKPPLITITLQPDQQQQKQTEKSIFKTLSSGLKKLSPSSTFAPPTINQIYPTTKLSTQRRGSSTEILNNDETTKNLPIMAMLKMKLGTTTVHGSMPMLNSSEGCVMESFGSTSDMLLISVRMRSGFETDDCDWLSVQSSSLSINDVSVDDQNSIQIKKTFEKNSQNLTITVNSNSINSINNELSSNEKSKFTIFSISEKEIAKQLILIDSETFRKIPQKEFLSLGWSGPNKTQNAPNIVQMTRTFNNVAGWVANEILKSESPKTRIQKIMFFIRVAKNCVDLGNFNSMYSVIGGLRCTPVYRLERTWAMVDRKEKAIFDKLSEIIAPDRNSDNYRRKLSSFKKPVVPYLGIFLADIFFLHEALKKEKNELRLQAVIDRQISIQELINEISLYIKNANFDFEQNDYIQSIIKSVEFDSKVEDEHYAISYTLEPKKKSNTINSNSTSTQQIKKSTDFEVAFSHKKDYSGFMFGLYNFQHKDQSSTTTTPKQQQKQTSEFSITSPLSITSAESTISPGTTPFFTKKKQIQQQLSSPRFEDDSSFIPTHKRAKSTQTSQTPITTVNVDPFIPKHQKALSTSTTASTTTTITPKILKKTACRSRSETAAPPLPTLPKKYNYFTTPTSSNARQPPPLPPKPNALSLSSSLNVNFSLAAAGDLPSCEKTNEDPGSPVGDNLGILGATRWSDNDENVIENNTEEESDGDDDEHSIFLAGVGGEVNISPMSIKSFGGGGDGEKKFVKEGFLYVRFERGSENRSNSDGLAGKKFKRYWGKLDGCVLCLSRNYRRFDVAGGDFEEKLFGSSELLNSNLPLNFNSQKEFENDKVDTNGGSTTVDETNNAVASKRSYRLKNVKTKVISSWDSLTDKSSPQKVKKKQNQQLLVIPTNVESINDCLFRLWCKVGDGTSIICVCKLETQQEVEEWTNSINLNIVKLKSRKLTI